MLSRRFAFKKALYYLIVAGCFFGQAQAMQEVVVEQRDEQQHVVPAISRSLSPWNHRIISLSSGQKNLIPLAFDQSQSMSVVNYQLNEQPVGRLIATDSMMRFEALGLQSYDFLLTSPLKTDLFEVATHGKFTFQKPVEVKTASLASKSVTFLDNFLSEQGLLVDADCCDSHGYVDCLDFLFKGKQFNAMSGSTLAVRGMASFPSLRGLFNDGRMFFAKGAVVNTLSLENSGDLQAENLELTATAVVNTGTIDIADSCIATCDTIDNQNKWSVGRDCFFKKVRQLTTSQNSQWRVGRDWKAYIENLFLEGRSSVGNLALFNIDSYATLGGPFRARILHVVSQGLITCTPQAKFYVDHHVGLKANGWIQYEGDALEKALLENELQPSSEGVDQQLALFPRGVFLYSEQSGIKKSGAIVARSGSVTLNAKKQLTATGPTESGFLPDAMLLMNAKSLILEKESLLKAFSAQLTGQEILEQHGRALVLKNLAMAAPKVVHGGSSDVGDSLAVKADEILAEVSSKMQAPNIALEAVEMLCQKGAIDAGSLSARAPSLVFEETSKVKAKNAQLQAQEIIAQRGDFDAENLSARAKFVENSGVINSQNAHIKADRWWWNSGSVTIEEALGIDALASLNILGWVQAKRLTVRAGIDLNILGGYQAQNADVNALIALNAGLYLPQLVSWDDLVTNDNFKASGETLGMMLAPPWLRVTWRGGKAIYGLPSMYRRSCILYQQAKHLSGKEDVGVSDWIPLLCDAKDLTVSAIQFAQTSAEIYNALNPVPVPQSSEKSENAEELKSAVDSAPVSVEPVKEDASKKQNYLREKVSELARWQTATSVIGVFGPHLNRKTLLDVDCGATFGINGHSNSIWNVHGGGSFFANSYTLDTCYGANYGVLGANDLNIYATRTYSSFGPAAYLYGRTGSVSAENLEVHNKIYMIDRLALQARKKARIGAAIAAKRVDIQAKEKSDSLSVELLVGSSVNAQDGPVNIVADQITSAAHMSAHSAVNMQAQKVDLQKGSDLHSKIGAVNVVGTQSVTNAGTLNAPTVHLEAPKIHLKESSKIGAQVAVLVASEAVQGDAGNDIATTDYAYIKTKKLNNQGTTHGALALNVTEQPTNIGEVDAQGKPVQYQGPLQDGFADELADGKGEHMQVANASEVIMHAHQQDVHLKEEHVVTHTIDIRGAKAIRADKKITSERSIHLRAMQNIHHASLKAGINVGLSAGIFLVAQSTTTRISNGANYEDVVDTAVSIEAGTSTCVDAGLDILYQSVSTRSGEGGTHYTAGRNMIDDAVVLEKHEEVHHKDKDGQKTTKDTYTTEVVSHHKSAGDYTVHAGGVYIGKAAIVDAQHTAIQGHQGTILLDVHDTHTYESDYEKDGGWFGQSEKSHKQGFKSTSRGPNFKGKEHPVLSAPQGGVIVTNPTGNAPIFGDCKTADVLLGQNSDEAVESKSGSNLIWRSRGQHAHKNHTFSLLVLNGFMESAADATVIQSVRGQSLELIKIINQQGDGTISQNFVDEMHWKHSDSSQGLTRGASAVLALAVTFATAGVASSAGATVATAMSFKSAIATTMVANMTAATVTSLSIQAVEALAASKGDVVKAAKILARTETLKNALISAATAGIMAGASQALNELGLPAVSEAQNFSERLAYAAPCQATRAVIGTGIGIIEGQDPQDALLQNFRQAAAGTLGSACASQIGSEYAQGNIDPITHNLLHTMTGAAEGGLIGGARGALTGGVAALTAETFADVFSPKKPTLDMMKDLEAQKGRPLTQNEFFDIWNKQLQEYARNVSRVETGAKMTAALAAFVAQQDVSTANFAASTAVDNNFVVLAAYGVMAASAAYSAYNIYNAYKDGGPSAALKQLGIEVALEVTGVVSARVLGKVVYKFGGVVYPTAKAAIDAALDKTPGLKFALGELTDELIVAGEKLGQSAFGQRVARVESVLVKAEANVVEKISQTRKELLQKVGLSVDSNCVAALSSQDAAVRAACAAEQNAASRILPTCDEALQKVTIFEKNAPHIFTEEHLLQDTIENRNLLSDVASDIKNLHGPDKYGNLWFAKSMPDGKQVWVSVRNNYVINGGINKLPKYYNPITGLSALRAKS